MFGSLFIVLIVMVLTAVLLTRFSVSAINRLGGKQIEMRHRAAQFISETGKVPPFWFTPEQRNAASRESANRTRSLRKLRKLLGYFKHSPMVEDEETRYIILKKLTLAYNNWLSLSWKEISE